MSRAHKPTHKAQVGRAENICASAKRDIADMCRSSGELHTLVATRLPNLQEGALAPMQVPPALALTSAAALSSRGALSRGSFCAGSYGAGKIMRMECPGWHVLAPFGCEVAYRDIR